jgi:fructokinase
MKQLISSMGEMLIDFLPIIEKTATVGFRMHPGGSPFNVAVGVARLGQPAAFVSKLGGDFFGRYLHNHLEQEGVAIRFLARDPQAPSTLVFVTMEDGEPSYTFYGAGAADTLLVPEDIPDAFFEETRIMHFSSINRLAGSMPMTVVATAKRFQGQQLISFDPNVRPSVIEDSEAYRDLVRVLIGLADVVKISTSDLAWLSPDQTVESAAADLLAQGPALVAVTRGRGGVLALRGGTAPQHWEIPAFPVTPVDTVGAGDAFSSGLLTALAEQNIDTRAALLEMNAERLHNALRFGLGVSALTCKRAGANPPARAEVDRFLQRA